MLIFLDDERTPDDVQWEVTEIAEGHVSQTQPEYDTSDLDIVKNLDSFKAAVINNGIPDTVSFDNDLGFNNGSGIEAARWLVRFCEDNLSPLPICYVHSKNPVAAREIVLSLLDYQSPLMGGDLDHEVEPFDED